MTGDHVDAWAAVDARLAELAPGLQPPAVRRRDAVLVVGPWLAGTSSLTAALRERLPQNTFVESADLGHGEVPVAVVFVVSAVAPLTESDCALLNAAAANTDLVLGAVSKIDVHRRWQDVLDTDRRALAAFAPRYADVPWVGVSAAPDLGDVQLDALVELLGSRLSGEGLERRNRLRAWVTRLESVMRQYDSAAESAGREARVARLRHDRADALRQRRVAKSERAIAMRSQVQQARVQLSYFARTRCASVRGELQEDAAGMTRRAMSGFAPYVERRAGEVVAEVSDGVTDHLVDVANELGLPVDSAQPRTPAPPQALEIGEPPLKSRHLETRLTMLLGAGFGLGVALTLSRLFADIAPGLALAGAVCCVLVGLAVTVWVVGVRGLLQDRAVLDRWVGEVTAALRASVDAMVATRVLTAETLLAAALGAQDEADSARVVGQVSMIDLELREHALAKASASAVRDRQVPPLQDALAAVRTELGELEPPATDRHTVGDDVVAAARGADQQEG